MSTIQDAIEVAVPVERAYGQWLQFEEFPRFMEEVEEVRRSGERHLHWKARVDGREREWDADIVELVPDERVAWRSTSGRQNDGLVMFEPTRDGSTRISVYMEFETEAADPASDEDGAYRVHRDLENFKRLVEGERL